MKSLGFIGTGNMATAIIKGISNAKLDVKMLGFDVDIARVDGLKKYGVTAKKSIHDVVVSDYIMLAVKPQSFTEVLQGVMQSINENTIIISIAAGISADYISKTLGFTAKVVRVMPNTPLMLNVGATALSKTANVTQDEFDFVQEIFNCAGISKVIPSNKMNEIIAINGSTPAFIYEFARCFMEYGEGVGLDKDTCLKLFSQTLIGSAKMITDSGNSIDELITMVSSKGGTTIAGLESLKQCNFKSTVQTACEKCVARAYELEQELSK